MYVCMYVCLYVCMYVRTYVCKYVCMYVCKYICMYVPLCFVSLMTSRSEPKLFGDNVKNNRCMYLVGSE
jgi:hypothetical protein